MALEHKYYYWIAGGLVIGIGGYVWLQHCKNKEQSVKANDEFTNWFLAHSDFKPTDKSKLSLVLASLTDEEKGYIKKSITNGDVSSTNIRLIGLVGAIKMDFQKLK